MVIIIISIFIFRICSAPNLSFYSHEDFFNFLDRKYNSPIAIMINETNNFDEKAINKKEDAVGVMQIRKIMVLDANRIIGFCKFCFSDRYNFLKSLEIFYIIQDHYNPEYDLWYL